MADKEAQKPAEPPKPVHIGGESFVDRILPHMKQIIVGIILIAAVLSVVFAVRWFQNRKDITATEKLDRILDVASRPIRAKDQKLDPAKPTFADAKERSAAVLDAMTKEGTELAGHAFRAGQLLDAGKVDEAITEYKRGTADKTIEGVLCREGLGLALEAKATAEKDATARQKGYEEALAAFAAVQPAETGPRKALSYYHQGRMQQLLGKKDEAKALFEKARVANKTNDAEITKLLDKRLAAMGAS